jgi:hypothetical protein
MELVHLNFQVRDVEAEKMALLVQKAKLEVTSDKQISYRVSIHVACLPIWQKMCKNLPNIMENILRSSYVANFGQEMHNRRA